MPERAPVQTPECGTAWRQLASIAELARRTMQRDLPPWRPCSGVADRRRRLGRNAIAYASTNHRKWFWDGVWAISQAGSAEVF